MTPTRALLTITAAMVLTAAIGSAAGALIGSLAPDYYRHVFGAGDKADFAPVQIGVGLGLNQGLIGGALIGLLVVAVLCWREKPRTVADEFPERSHSVFVIASILIGLFIASTISWGVGFLQGTLSGYQREYRREQAAVAPILAGDGAFHGITVHQYSGGGCYLAGSVPTKDDLKRLQAELTTAFGESRARQLIGSVSTPKTAP